MGDQFPPVKRIPTGSLELDYITGGGIPVGRWTRLYGGSGSGKSLTAYKVIGNAQKMGYTCAYVDAEKQYDPEWAEHHGVDTTALIVINSSVIEEIGETVDALLDTVDLFVIDSCSICVSRVKLEDGLNDRQYMGLNARQWQEQFVHLNSHFDHSRNTIIYLDHVRVQFGMGGISSLKPPGGKAMEFISSLTLEYKQGKWLWKRDGIFSDTRNTSQKTLSGGTEADGMEIKVKCQKSRVSKQFRTANLYLDLEEGSFDWVEEYFKAAKFFKIVEGAAWLKFEGSDKSLRPKEVKEMIREDEELREKIRNRMMENA
jgi:recombination protein RecA